MDVLVPNLAEEFWPPLQPLCGKVDVCKSVVVDKEEYAAII